MAITAITYVWPPRLSNWGRQEVFLKYASSPVLAAQPSVLVDGVAATVTAWNAGSGWVRAITPLRAGISGDAVVVLREAGGESQATATLTYVANQRRWYLGMLASNWSWPTRPAGELAAGTPNSSSGNALSAQLSLTPARADETPNANPAQNTLWSVAAGAREFMGLYPTMPMYGITTIESGTWHIALAARRVTSGTSTAYLKVAIYVWRPGVGVVGTVYDNTAGTGTEGGAVPYDAATTSYAITYDVSGARVTGVQDGDQIVTEVWVYAPGPSLSQGYLYWNGSVEPGASGSIVGVSAAPYVEAPVDLSIPPNTLTLSPTHVSPNGGATVTFTANGWLGATAAVTVDGASIAATVVDANHGTFTSPLHATGAPTVSVTSNGITKTATLWYDAVVPPADTDYAAYFLSSLSAVVLLETLEISHPEFSQTYWVVRNKTDGLRALLETGAPQDFDYHPLRIRSQSARDNLDAGLEVDLGDLGEIVPQEIDRLLAAASAEPPTVRYRAYRSDDLTRPLYGPIRYEMGPITMAKEGASFEAKAPSLNISRTGATYSLAVFPMLRGCI